MQPEAGLNGELLPPEPHIQQALDDARETANKGTPVNLQELLDLWAIDTELFAHEFFPGTVRQRSPAFHSEIDRLLDDPEARFVGMQIFRGGAKTTKLRIFTAKRIAFAISRTILYIGINQAKAIQSLDWIKTQVEKNAHFTRTFRIKKGKIWSQDEIEIVHEGASTVDPLTGQIVPFTIRLIAVGITGGHRGVNIDDWRPDLILVDDVVDEENAATQEGRNKIFNLVVGALKNGLSPRSESPLAKLVVLQTPIAFEDLSEMLFKHSEFKCIRQGCWTRETEGLPLEERESAWAERWTSSELREQRIAAMGLNKLSLFSREMECKLVAPENSLFKAEWLEEWGGESGRNLPPLHEMWTVLVIDPVPPPSDAQRAKNLEGKDYEALGVVGRRGNEYFICEISRNRGHEPSWTVSEFFRLANKWKVRKVIVESVAYQRTLAWLLRQAMRTAGRFWLVEEFDDRRKKQVRIAQGLTGISSNHMLFVNRQESGEFISQFIAYPNVQHDDDLEVIAIGCTSLEQGVMPGGSETYMDDESEIPALEYERGAP